MQKVKSLKTRGLLVSVIITLCLSLSLYGCTDPYGVAAKLAQDVAVSVNQADSTIDSFRTQGSISADEERNILGYLNSLNTIDAQYIACVQVAHGQSFAGGFTKCAQTLASAMGDPTTLAALHISNSAKQTEVKTGWIR